MAKHVGVIHDKIYSEAYYAVKNCDEFTFVDSMPDLPLYQRRRVYLDENPENIRNKKIWYSRWRSRRINTTHGLILEEGKDDGRYSDLYEKYRADFLNKTKR